MHITTDLKQNILLRYWLLLFGYFRMTKDLQSYNFDQYRRPNTPLFLGYLESKINFVTHFFNDPGKLKPGAGLK